MRSVDSFDDDYSTDAYGSSPQHPGSASEAVGMIGGVLARRSPQRTFISLEPDTAGRVLRLRWSAFVRRWGIDVLILLVVAVVLPVAIAAHYHSLSDPNLDDWAYDLAAYHLAFHGSFDLYHWGPSNMIGQLIMVAPVLWLFGEHVWVLNVWTCLTGFAGLVALAHLGRQLGLPRRSALFAAAGLGLGPMWAALSTSFMLDIPSLSLMTVALAVAASDFRTDRIMTVRAVSALAIAAVAFTIRDETVIAIAAIAWWRLWRNGRPSLRQAVPWLLVVGGLAVCLSGFELWRLNIPSTGHGQADSTPSSQWAGNLWMLPLVGFLLAPVAAFIGPISTVRQALASSRSWTMLAWSVMPGLPIIGYLGCLSVNYRSSDRSLSSLYYLATPSITGFLETIGVTSSGPPGWVLILLGVVSLAATTVVVAAAVQGVHRWRSADRSQLPKDPTGNTVSMLVSVVAGSWLIFAVGIKWDLQAWDRYILPLVVYVPILVLYARHRSGQHLVRPPKHRFGLIALAGIAVTGLLGTFAIDGFVGSEWSYSAHFATTVPATPAKLIYTFWSWTAMQNKNMDYADPPYLIRLGYQPCYVQEIDGYTRTGTSLQAKNAVYRRNGGSWIQPLTYSMVSGPNALHNPACHQSEPKSP